MTDRLPEMDDPMRLPAGAAADVWLVRREGGADVESDPAFARWLSAAPENVTAWARASGLWERLGGETADPLIEAMRRDALAARPRPAPLWGLAAAGVAAALLVGVTGWMTLGPRLPRAPDGPWIATTTGATFTNGQATPKTVTLADGSEITLDADTAVAVAIAGPRRGVRLLRGQAYFKVVHDPARPFRVEAGDRWISDLGTEFLVREAGESLYITVARGSVSVSTPKTPKGTVLAAGQKVVVTPSGVGAVTASNPAADLTWRDGILEFHDISLAEAVRQINSRGGVPVTVSGVGDLRVSGRFRPGDPRRFAHALAEIYPLQVHDRPDGGADIRRKGAH